MEENGNVQSELFYSLLPKSLAEPWESVNVSLVPDVSSLGVDKGAGEARVVHHPLPLLVHHVVRVVVDRDPLEAHVHRRLDQVLPGDSGVAQALLQLPGAGDEARHTGGQRT